MTENLYQRDSYLQSFDAQVVAVDEETHSITLDRSAFYPGGGGQPYDTGVLQADGRRLPVVKAKRAGSDVLHFIDPGAALPGVGTTVQGQIDWARRYALMRTHTAMHILCGVIFRDYGASVTGGDMDPLEGRMDFEFETMQRELIDHIQAAVNREVAANHPLRVDILPRQQAFAIPDLIRTKINLLPEGIQQVRVVEIVGLDLQADGGTHVRSTGEVGQMRITDYKSKGKINKRIYVTVEDLG